MRPRPISDLTSSKWPGSRTRSCSRAQFKQLLTNLKVEGQEKVGERTAWVVSGSSQWLPQVRLYFDRDTAYLLSLSYQQKSHYCCHVFRIDYDDFYVTNGIRVPMEWTVNGPRESILVYEIRYGRSDPDRRLEVRPTGGRDRGQRTRTKKASGLRVRGSGLSQASGSDH